MKDVIASSKKTGDTTANIQFLAIQQVVLHPYCSVPQLYHDQLNNITKHLHHVKEDINEQRFQNDNDNLLPTVKKLIHKS